MASTHTREIMKEMERVRNQQKKKSVKVEPTIEERNTRILNLLDQGIKVKDVAARMSVTPATVYQLKSLAKKDVPVIVEEKKPIKPLREKEIAITPVPIEKVLKQATDSFLVEEFSISLPNESDSLKSTILDLNKQLDRFREGERNIRSEMITQKLTFEKQLAIVKEEKEKAYADYSLEVENNKRLRKQVEDLLMIDGLNVGLMQQNLMFRERFGMLQEGERL